MHASNPETIYFARSRDWTQARLITISGSVCTVPMSHITHYRLHNSSWKVTNRTVPKRTKTKILQRNRLDANSSVSVKLWKRTKNRINIFEGSNKNFRDRGFFWVRWQLEAQKFFTPHQPHSHHHHAWERPELKSNFYHREIKCRNTQLLHTHLTFDNNSHSGNRKSIWSEKFCWLLHCQTFTFKDPAIPA